MFRRFGRLSLPVVGVLMLVGLWADVASGSRKATGKEATAVDAPALKACDAKQRELIAAGDSSGQVPCHRRAAPRISTVNPRFGFSYETGEQWSGALVHRSTARSEDWRIVATQGSGINSCRYWLQHAPTAVVRDLDLEGVSSDGSRVEHCGAPEPRALIQDLEGGLYKPKSFCPSNHTCFSHAHWLTWGTTAVAEAMAMGGGPGGPVLTYQTKITFSKIQSLCGGRRYTQATWSRGATTFIRVGGCGTWSGG